MTDDEITADVDRFVDIMEQTEKHRWERAQPPTPPDRARQRIDAMRSDLRRKRT